MMTFTTESKKILPSIKTLYEDAVKDCEDEKQKFTEYSSKAENDLKELRPPLSLDRPYSQSLVNRYSFQLEQVEEKIRTKEELGRLVELLEKIPTVTLSFEDFMKYNIKL